MQKFGANFGAKISKKYPFLEFSAGHADCLGLAVEPKLWEKIKFENEKR